jgi:xylulokinase
MSPFGSPVTVGVDIGTTSVKALAVDEKGQVVARSRVPHSIVAPEPDVLRHDAKKAWRAGPRKAFAEVTAQLEAEGNSLAGVAVASMVPSMTAVGRQGVPVLPGLLYGDREGRPSQDAEADAVLPLGAMPDAEGFLRWAAAEVPDARGYWPCQAVATNAISGLPAIDTGVTASLGLLHSHKGWNVELLGALGV